MLEKGNHIPSIRECFSMIEVRKKGGGTEGTNLDMLVVKLLNTVTAVIQKHFQSINEIIF